MKKDIEVYEKMPAGFSSEIQTAACYLELEQKLLLLQLAPPKLEAGKWGVPAGKLEKNETPTHAAVRELFEETGVRLDSSNKIRFLTTLYIRKPEIAFSYHLFKVEIDHFPSIYLSSEHQAYKWVSFDEISRIGLMKGAYEAFQFYSKFKL